MPELNHDVYDVTIMGTGPAGLTAAIYTCRANLTTVMFEGDLPGGQLTQTSDVENFPGFENGIIGYELMDEMRKQAMRFGAESHYSMIEKVDFSSAPYAVTLSDGTVFHTRTLIISSGAAPRRLHIPGEEKLWGKGVSSCAVCDAAFYPDKRVIVVGGGDSAMEEAMVLSRYASKVTVVHRRDTLRASKIMQDRAMNNPKVEFKWSHTVSEIHGSEELGVQGITLVDLETDKSYEYEADGFFLAIGHIPNTSVFVDSELELDEEGYISTAPDSTATNIPGVFAVGDVQDKIFRQAITAAGTGCMGALEAEHYLMALQDDVSAAAE